MDSSVHNRINLLRFVMIFGVVVLHTPQYVPVTEIGSDGFSFFKAFFQSAMFRTAVPVLSFISGYLVFSTGLDRSPRTLLVKKSRSLLIPFLAFNLPLIAFVCIGELRSGFSASYRLIPFDAKTWLDAAFGLTQAPINYPLHFLRDMMVIMCMAPLMGWLIRQSGWLGLMLVTLVFLNNLDGTLILRSTMPILFYAGGLAAWKKWDLKALDRFALPCLVLFLGMCAMVVYFRVADTTLLRLISIVLIWPAASLLAETVVGNWCSKMNKYSFFLFVAHAPVLFVSWLLFKRFGTHLPYPLYWVAMPVLTLLLLVIVYEIGMRVMPNIFPLMLGGRSTKINKPGQSTVLPTTAPSFSGIPDHLTEPQNATAIQS